MHRCATGYEHVHTQVHAACMRSYDCVRTSQVKARVRVPRSNRKLRRLQMYLSVHSDCQHVYASLMCVRADRT